MSSSAGRRPLVVANWKMYKTLPEAEAWLEELRARLPPGGAEVIVAPAFVHIVPLARSGAFAVAGQNCWVELEGAFTGEVSPLMLRDAGACAVLVGHSERRQHFGESDELVARKVDAAARVGLTPILCVGETLEERDLGRTEETLVRQLRRGLLESPALERVRARELVVAYEPVWAIGTGRNATPEQAREAVVVIRRLLARALGDEAARVRVLYGGSVTPDNAAELLEAAPVDGALVGSASRDAKGFAAIAEAVARRS